MSTEPQLTRRQSIALKTYRDITGRLPKGDQVTLDDVNQIDGAPSSRGDQVRATLRRLLLNSWDGRSTVEYR